MHDLQLAFFFWGGGGRAARDREQSVGIKLNSDRFTSHVLICSS